MATQEPKVTKAFFPDASFIRPGTPTEADVEVPKGSSVRDTHFANLYRSWMRDGAIGHDPTVHDEFRSALESYIRKTTSILMVTSDASTSAQAVGLRLSLDTASIDEFAKQVLDMELFSSICDIVGMNEYKNEIVMRELERTFGTARQLDAERRNVRKRDEEQAKWTRNTGSGIHNMLRELTVIMRQSLNVQNAQSVRVPDPVRPELLRALHQTIASNLKASEAEATETQEEG